MNLSEAYQYGSGRIFDYIILNRGASKTAILDETGLETQLIESILERGLNDKILEIKGGKYLLQRVFYREWVDYSDNVHQEVKRAISILLGNTYADANFKEKFGYRYPDLRKFEIINNLLEDVIRDFKPFENILADMLRYHTNAFHDEPGLHSDVNDALAKLGISFPLQELRIAPISQTLSKPAVVSTPSHEIQEKFITVEDNWLPDQFYGRLILEINKCYSVEAFIATRSLLRKLCENLTYDILHKKYQHDDTKKDLYWKTDEYGNRALDFSHLINNFQDNVADFEPYSRKITKVFFKKLKTIKRYGDQNIHSIEFESSKEQLDSIQNDVNDLIDVFCRIYSKIV